jgi:hypothetical protein
LNDWLFSAKDQIDKLKIRGEFKIWIYKSYLVPSLRFHLQVDAITEPCIKGLQERLHDILRDGYISIDVPL